MFGFPEDASLHGHEVDGSIRYLALTTGACFAAVVLFLTFAMLFHREGRPAHFSRGHDRWNLFWAGSIAAVVFVGVDLASLGRSLARLREGTWSFPEGATANPFRIEVTAQQWSWTFRYPGDDGLFGTADDIVAMDELRVPVDRPVFVQLRSKDVVHSFYLPNFRTKVDAIPGHTTRLWFVPRRSGLYEIACSQHCGVSHYRMRAELRVVPEADWKVWAARAAKETAARFAAIDGETMMKDRGVSDGWPWEARR